MPSINTDRWLERVFNTPGTGELADTYDAWAASYDADMLAVGYLHPAVAAGFVGRYIRALDGPILDAGAGTGIVGQILSVMGYRNLVGIDISGGMLARARERGVYADLRNQVLGETLDFADESFVAVVATGVFTAGHAPASAFIELLRVTRSGGHLIFSVGKGAWENGGFREYLAPFEATGRFRTVEATQPYRAMPFSLGEGTSTARMFVYEVA